MNKKYGFIYIWFDKKRKMYYIGSHWGSINDSYICSSNRMRDAYRRRPHDFKRRILKSNISRTSLLDEEYKWLAFINENELGKKYYNLRNKHFGHWATNDIDRTLIREKMRKYQNEKVAAGIHPWIGDNNPSIKKIKNGTHHWLYPEHKEKTRLIQCEKVKNCNHPFVDGELAKKTNNERIKNGTHNFLNGEIRKQIDEKRCHTWKITFPNGEIMIAKNLKSFCIENNLNQGAMNQVGLGKKKSYKGIKCEKIEEGLIKKYTKTQRKDIDNE